VSDNRPSRYHLAEQHDGRGWMLFRLAELGGGFPAKATVVECNLPEAAARLRLLEVRAAEVLEPDYPIELVDEELREAGGDPEAIGKRGAALIETLLAKRRERAS
jgi:hypothetical protein